MSADKLQPEMYVLRSFIVSSGCSRFTSAREPPQTSTLHGLRGSRCKYFSASFCTVLVWSFHSIRSLLRYAMLPNRHVADERKHFSISLFGRWRVFTHSRKFVQCSGCGSDTRFISLACRSDPFSGVTL